VVTTPNERPRRKANPGPSTTTLPAAQLLLEPYVLAGMDVYQLYYANKSQVEFVHRLYKDPMNILFWDILLGVTNVGWLESNVSVMGFGIFGK